MKLNHYRIVVACDAGLKRFRVTARNKAIAILIVMQAEQCPSHAILKVQSV